MTAKFVLADYTGLADSKYWRTWSAKTKILADSHGLGGCFDEMIDPSTVDYDDQDFLACQRIAFSVLSAKITFPEGVSIVKSFEQTRDALRTWRALHLRFESGLASRLDANMIEKELATLELTDKWTQGTVAFLSRWHNKVTELTRVRAEEPSRATKIAWLQGAVRRSKELSQAISTYETFYDLSGHTDRSYSFDDLYTAVLNAARTYDANNKEKTNSTTCWGNNSKCGDNKTGANKAKDKGNKDKDWSQAERIPDDVWKAMTWNQKRDYLRKRRKEKGTAGKDNTSTNAQRSVSTAQTDANTSAGGLPSGLQEIPTATIPNLIPRSVTSATASQAPSPGAALRTMLSSTTALPHESATPATTTLPNTDDRFYQQDGKLFRLMRITNANLHYNIASYGRDSTPGALIDGGANGGMSGSDVRVIETHMNSTVNVTGIADLEVKELPLVTAAALIETNLGPIIGYFYQYAHLGTGKTIHSKAQLSSWGVTVDDCSRQLGGKQRVITREGHVIPLTVRDGLSYMMMRPPSDYELENLPHVHFTSASPWDPSCVDNEYTVNDLDDVSINPDDYFDGMTNVSETGEITLDYDLTIDALRHSQSTCYDSNDFYDPVEDVIDDCIRSIHGAKVNKVVDWEAIRKYFAFLPADRIKQTFENTTQWFRASTHYPMRTHYKSRFPAANVQRIHEPLATDILFGPCPAHDDGIPGHGGTEMLQVYFGLKSGSCAGYPLKHKSDMAKTFAEHIRTKGAPTKLIRDDAKEERSKDVMDLLRYYAIDDWTSEPYHEWQNYAERKIQDIKRTTNSLMDRTGTPAKYWLLCTLFILGMFNVVAHETNHGRTPIEVQTGQQPDISAYLAFYWFEPVVYKGPGDRFEKAGYWVGPAENIGDVLTHSILTKDTQQVVYRSNVRSAHTPINKRLSENFDPDRGEIPSVITTTADLMDDPSEIKIPVFAPDELLGLTFLREQEDGTRVRAEVIKKVLDRDAAEHQNIKFLLKLSDGELEELITYNELSDLIERQHLDEATRNDKGELFLFSEVSDHKGPLKHGDPEYKGSSYNVKVHWENGEVTWEPLDEMIKDDPVTLANYAKKCGLLDTPGWKRLKRYAKSVKKLQRMLKQVHAFKNNTRKTEMYMFGVRVPRTMKEALALDQKNNNTKWKDAIDTEINQLHEYNTFKDLGKGVDAPEGFQRINVHFVFAVKHDLRHKARLVAGGHLTKDPEDGSAYSGVVSLRAMRIAVLLAELNDLKIYSADVGNAYLEAKTKEKVYIIAGPEFGDLTGHTLIIYKALYGLKTSGAAFHARFAETLRSMGFKPSKNEPDVWLHPAGNHYEYICVYVDDLLIMMKDPEKFTNELQSAPHNYILKGVGPPTYHLGGDFYRDEDGTLCWGAKTYVKKMVATYESLFGEPPKEYTAPLDKDDHPELDLSEELDDHGIKQYQSLIGAMQWSISLCRFEISTAVMTLGRFRVAPRKGHMDRVKRIIGFLKKQPDAAIRFRTGRPSHSDFVIQEYDWCQSVYGCVTEEIPHDIPIPLGRKVRLTTFVDANLYHDMITGRSVTGVLHFLNQTPIDWFSKHQNTVETATYGSEFVAARIAMEQVMDFRLTLRYLGVELDGPAYLFGDNQSVLTSSTIPHSMLSKWHNALSYHRVREAIAAGIAYFLKIDGKQNPADALSKFLPYAIWWPLIQPILYWKGETLIFVHSDVTEGSDRILILNSVSDRGADSILSGIEVFCSDLVTDSSQAVMTTCANVSWHASPICVSSPWHDSPITIVTRSDSVDTHRDTTQSRLLNYQSE